MHERAELVSKLDHLQRSYEFTVQELTKERNHIKVHDKRHLQLIAAKNLVNVVHNLISDQKQSALESFTRYCKFDSICFRALKNLS